MTHSSFVHLFYSIFMSYGVIWHRLYTFFYYVIEYSRRALNSLLAYFVFLHNHCSSFLEDFMHFPCTTRTCGVIYEAPTAAVFTVRQGLVLCKLEHLMTDYIDLYRRNGSTDDAVICILEKLYSLLEETGSSVRLMFFGSPMQHHLLVQKL